MDMETVPRTGAEDVRWDLSDLYADADDPALVGDVDEAVRRAESFADRYRGTVADLGATALGEACADLEAVWLPLRRAMAFAHLRHAVDTTDEQVGSLVAQLSERAAAVSSTVRFFDLEWNTMDDRSRTPAGSSRSPRADSRTRSQPSSGRLP